MICYHGSDTIVDAPVIFDSKRPLDFGDGFYVTTSEEQARAWARRVALRNMTEYRCVNKYEFDIEKARKELVVVVFESADEKWLDFVCANRSGKDIGYQYDIVIGPVADDKVYRVVVEYENGDIDRKTALEKMQADKLNDQILFHTAAALKYLSYVDAEVI